LAEPGWRAQPLLGPSGVGEQTGLVQRDGGTADVDLAGGPPTGGARWCRAGEQEVVRRILDDDPAKMTGHYAASTLEAPAKIAGSASLPIIAVKSEVINE
jgi:hypothetical protein